MNWFLRLKLGQKLILSFVVCALLTTVVGSKYPPAKPGALTC